MIQFSYTKSSTLLEKLGRIDEARKTLLLTPLSPKNETKLEWECLLDRIYFSFALDNKEIERDSISQLLSPAGKTKLDPLEREIVNYKTALNYLYHNWLVNDEAVTPETLAELYSTAFSGKLPDFRSEADNILRYLQINPEHPVIQAALAQILITKLYYSVADNERFSHLVFLLFLYKNGYDMKRMVTVEKHFFGDMSYYKDLVMKTSRQNNLTGWLEYVADALIGELDDLTHRIMTKRFDEKSDDLFNLNDRQKAILSLFDLPGTKISNRNVQKMYRVSQITASRDLSKLASMGLLFTIGKGRSTYYTKV